ncbi:MAG: GHKL domain-containing protein [Clostridia bacterium]|nr:GHKL domain-containing protein [Clostridia bacterium]MBR3554182.1 GHKL domain-containing protein [Clostridia bacterium]
MTAGTAALCVLENWAAVFGLLSFLHCIFRYALRLTAPRLAIAALVLMLPAAGGLLVPALTAEYDGVLDFAGNALCFAAACLLVQRPKPLSVLWKTLVYTFTVEVFWGLIAFYTTRALWLEYTVCTVLYLAAGAALLMVSFRSETHALHRFVDAVPKWVYAVLLLFEVMCYYKAYGEETGRFDVLFLISSAALIVSFVFLLFRVLRLSQEENRILQQMTVQKEFAEQSITDDAELRRFRHDYKNHMLVVRALLEDGRFDEARQYLDAMQGTVHAAMYKIKTGNFVADALLNHKAQTAADENITLKFSGAIPADGIRDDDLCTVLSNLIDNAIEACRKAGGAQVVFAEVRTVHETFLLSISNPTDGDASAASAGRTTKADRRNHGFGLKNVERAVKKYNGQLETTAKDGTFVADVMLHLQTTAV